MSRRSRSSLSVKMGIGTIAIAMAAACSNSANPQAEDPSAATTVKDYTKEAGELVIQDLGQGNEEQFNKSYGDYLRKKFPNFKITFIQVKSGTRFSELVATGQNVDIVYNSIENIVPELIGTNSQYDMTELIKKHDVDLSKFDQTTMDGIRTMGDGKIFFLPVTNMIQVLFYNKDIFNKLGVAYPKDGMTWDEIVELSKRMTRSEGGVNYMGLSASPNHIMRMNQLSVPVYDPATKKPTFTDERWKTLLQTYFMNINSPSYTEFTATKKKLPYYTEMTNTQELAMMIFNSMFPFDGPQYVQNLDWDLVSLPVFKDKPKTGSMASAVVFAVTTMSKNKDAAMQAIKHLTSVEMQTEYSKRGMITILNDDGIKKQIGSESPFKDKNWKAVYYNELADLSRKSIYDAKLLGMLTADIPKLITGEWDVNSLLRNAQEQAEKYLEAEMQKQ